MPIRIFVPCLVNFSSEDGEDGEEEGGSDRGPGHGGGGREKVQHLAPQQEDHKQGAKTSLSR